MLLLEVQQRCRSIHEQLQVDFFSCPDAAAAGPAPHLRPRQGKQAQGCCAPLAAHLKGMCVPSQVLLAKHPRQPGEASRRWPAMVHKGFQLAWTAGGFRYGHARSGLVTHGCGAFIFLCHTHSMLWHTISSTSYAGCCHPRKMLPYAPHVCRTHVVALLCFPGRHILHHLHVGRRKRVLERVRQLLGQCSRGGLPRILLTGARSGTAHAHSAKSTHSDPLC